MEQVHGIYVTMHNGCTVLLLMMKIDIYFRSFKIISVLINIFILNSSIGLHKVGNNNGKTTVCT